MSLTKEDLSAIASLFKEQNEQFGRQMKEQETRLEKLLDKRLRDSENAILSEVDRVQEIAERNIQKLAKNIEELKEYYRINRIENENSTLLMNLFLDLKKEVEQIKKSIA